MKQENECTIDKIIRVLSGLESKLNEIEIPPKSKKATSVAQTSEKAVEEKKPSRWWGRCREKFKKISKVKHEASEGGSNRRSTREADLVIEKLQSDIRQMKAAFDNLTKFQSLMTLELGLPSKKLNAMLEKKDSIRSHPDDLKIIRNKIFDLKCQIPSLLYKQSSRVLSITDSQTAEENVIDETGSDIYLPGLHNSQELQHSTAFEQVVDKFKGLDFTKKLCLLSFAVFPENKNVERTMLMYWWIGEEFIPRKDDYEKSVTEILDAFSRKELLEEVKDEKKLKPTSYKMEPHVHSAVIYLARYVNLFDLYDDEGRLFMKPKRPKVCLVKGSSLQQEAKTSKMEPKSLKTVFNSSERYPDFTFKWFPLMESLKVLYLGRWERTAKRHIEVESTENLKRMKALKNLRLASFQGISRIQELEKSICALPKLVILDLRACYNLETLPEDIGKLENLIYLDVSECYMLDRMPRGIADLLKLQVLKGFVISQNDDEKKCAVRRLKSLKKLSITVNKSLFKVENLMESLKDLKYLESLKIAWGAGGGQDKRGDNNKVLKEQEVDQVHKTSEEKIKKVSQVAPEDGTSAKANLEQGKKQEEVRAEGENKTSPSGEPSTGTMQNKPDNGKGKSKVEEEGDGDKGKVNQEEGKKQDGEEAGKSKSDNGVEGVKKAQDSTDAVQNKPAEKEGNGDKGKADSEEGTKRDEVKAESSKSTEKKPDDHQRGEGDRADGEKEKVNLEEGKNKDAESSKADKVIEGDEKTNPLQESKDTVQSKPDDQKEKNKVSFSEEALIQKKPDDLKRDDAMTKESHGTASPSIPEKTEPKKSTFSQVKLYLRKVNETKRWDNQATHTAKLPSSLKKLELECFPDKKPPRWLNPDDLCKLEKLSIRGGNLSRIGEEPPIAKNNWQVQILRLKYLHEFKAKWKELQALFPKMVLLEKYQCPKVAFCPTDGNGVWKSPDIPK